MRKPILVLTLIMGAFFYGCVSENLYYWGSYESQVYAYLNGESIERQISSMEQDRAKIASSEQKAAPGFYAHLGMLYAEVGDAENAIICFEEEKANFPEAAHYMDYLLGRYVP